MTTEPAVKRAIAFVDGQNLFHSARNAFGYTFPTYDVSKLAKSISAAEGWQLSKVYFYTGIPSQADNPFCHGFWTKKLAMMGRRGVEVYSRQLVYRPKTVSVPAFGEFTFLNGEEKGIDVRLALDALDLAHRSLLDVALIFSQDQDLSELASRIRAVAKFQNRWIKIASAYPDFTNAKNPRGINHTDWCPIDKQTYDTCIDRRDYRAGRTT